LKKYRKKLLDKNKMTSGKTFIIVLVVFVAIFIVALLSVVSWATYAVYVRNRRIGNTLDIIFRLDCKQKDLFVRDFNDNFISWLEIWSLPNYRTHDFKRFLFTKHRPSIDLKATVGKETWDELKTYPKIKNWFIYSNYYVSKFFKPFQQLVSSNIKEYFKKDYIFKPNTLVIHYRAGDILLQNKIIHYKSIVSAARDFQNDNILQVNILTGGMAHQTNEKTIELTLKIIEGLKKDISILFPNSKVEIYRGKSSDDDFLQLAISSHVIIAQGSFAIAGAIGNVFAESKIRSPRVDNLDYVEKPFENNPNIKRPRVERISPNWELYDANIVSTSEKDVL